MAPRARGSQRNDRAPWKVGTTVTPRAPGSLVAASAVRLPIRSRARDPRIPASHSTVAPDVGMDRRASASPAMACAGLVN